MSALLTHATEAAIPQSAQNLPLQSDQSNDRYPPNLRHKIATVLNKSRWSAVASFAVTTCILFPVSNR